MAVQCAAKILGVGDPRSTYDRFDIQTWRDKLQAEHRDSGLPGAIQKLTKEMVDSARINALLSEADAIIRQLRKMSNIQECVLFLYSPPSLDLGRLADGSSLRQGEPRTTTTLQEEVMTKHASSSRPC